MVLHLPKSFIENENTFSYLISKSVTQRCGDGQQRVTARSVATAMTRSTAVRDITTTLLQLAALLRRCCSLRRYYGATTARDVVAALVDNTLHLVALLWQWLATRWTSQHYSVFFFFFNFFFTRQLQERKRTGEREKF